MTLLGKLPVEGSGEFADAVVRIEKTALSADTAGDFLTKSLDNSKLIEGTDIVRPTHSTSYPDMDRHQIVHMDVRMARDLPG